MPTARITVHCRESIATINANLYGHFAEHLGSCIEQGLWVGEDSSIPNIDGLRRDAVEALQKLHIPLLRWPGGCFADDYHWRDGIGPRDRRPRTVNLWWGQAIECNHFGTHEFLRLCRLLGCQPYLAGNVGSGSPRELRDWAEYCNFPGGSTLSDLRCANGSPEPFAVRYWGVGNENWGCGGNFCPEDYAAEYKRFVTYLPDFGGTPLFLIACGPDGNQPEWTRRFLSKLGTGHAYWNHRLHGFAAHYYTWNADGHLGAPDEFDESQWYEMLHKAGGIEALILQQRAILDGFDPQRKIGLVIDEWGTWEPQVAGKSLWWTQNSMRDALAAALTLDVFNCHADKVVMANLAQMVNVLQALILTDGNKMLTTPTYHVFDLYQTHQGGKSLRTHFDTADIPFRFGPDTRALRGLSGSASIKDNRLTLSIVNPHLSDPIDATIILRDGRFNELQVSELAHEDPRAYNSFGNPHRVKPRRSHLALGGAEWTYTFAPASITVFHAALA